MPVLTIGAAEYPSYSTVENADSWHAPSLTGTAWASRDEGDKVKGLVTATRYIKAWLDVQGLETDPAAADQPQSLADASAELAEYLLAGGTALLTTGAVGAQDKRRVKAGSAEVEYFRPSEGKPMPTPVLSLLTAYVNSVTGGSALGGSYATGTCERSTFLDRRWPDLSGGYS